MFRDDSYYLIKCFGLAEKGRGAVSPNPLVGSVIVRDDEIISEGYHSLYGGSHAEAAAIQGTDRDLAGATLYCNLEPCCHSEKQTPPCTPLIIKSGIKRVVFSNYDPNPSVNGKGALQLEKAGIKVNGGVCKDLGERINRFYFKSVQKKIPYVTVKIAQSKDGFINSLSGRRTILTSDKAETFVHNQRSFFDAVLVGANTVKTDNPYLTVRKSEGRNPVRVIIDGNLSSNILSNVYSDEWKNSTWVFTSENGSKRRKEIFRENGIRLIELDSDSDNWIKMGDVLKFLYLQNIRSLFVEGGAVIFNQFISDNHFDELIILESPVLLGEGIKAFRQGFPININLDSVESIFPDEKRIYSALE